MARTYDKKRGRPPYPAEMPELAVRTAFDHQGAYASQWKATHSIAKKLSINHEMLCIWVSRAETDPTARRPGLTSDERRKRRALEREVKQLRRANEMADFGGTQRTLRTSPMVVR